MTGTGVTQLPDTQVKIRIYPCPAETKINPCPVESFFETIDPDQLVSFKSHLVFPH